MIKCFNTPFALKVLSLNHLDTRTAIDDFFVGRQLERKLLKGHANEYGLLDQHCLYHIRSKPDNPGAGKLIGFVTLEQHNDGVPPDEGWFLLDEYNGLGYATEAAKGLLNYATEVLGIQEVVAWPKEKNAGSVKVAERIGLVRGGQIRDRKTGELRAVFVVEGMKWPPVDGMLLPESRQETAKRKEGM